MPKRAAASSSGTPAPKQPRVDGPSPATAPAARPHGRVVLNVGGTRFESSRSTLERASSYFRSLLTRWDDASDEPLFIDCDANAFEILLSYMRIGVLTLPQAGHAQGIVRGAQEGSYEGNRIAGPVGGAVGGVVGAGVGGAVGAVEGVLGIPHRHYRHRCRGYYDGYHRFHCYR